jgi:signal transduction histidine kinase
MNDIPPLDSPTLADHHEHDTRIIRLEVQMSNVSVTLESMQERMDQKFESLTEFMADVAKELRAEHLRVMESVGSALQHNSDALRAALQHDSDKLNDKLQRQSDELSARLQHSSDELSARLQHDSDMLDARLQHESAMQGARLQHNCDALRASLKQITDAQQSIWEALQREIYRLDNKIDRMNRWVMGLFFTYLVATAALFARPYLNI